MVPEKPMDRMALLLEAYAPITSAIQITRPNQAAAIIKNQPVAYVLDGMVLLATAVPDPGRLPKAADAEVKQLTPFLDSLQLIALFVASKASHCILPKKGR